MATTEMETDANQAGDTEADANRTASEVDPVTSTVEAPGTNPEIEPDRPVDRRSPHRRPTDARLARLHLRMGSLGLARAELESLAGAGELDDPALVDLAEVRWRTGDLPGAGEAAAAYLDAIGADSPHEAHDELTALVVAAEAMSGAGRTAEARRLAAHALEQTSGSLDGLFAGMPRANIWPHDAVTPGGQGNGLAGPTAGQDGTAAPSGGAARTATDSHGALVHARAETAAVAPTLWKPEAIPLASEDLRMVADAPTQLEAARACLDAGDPDAAATRLAVLLRTTSGTAPAVLELVAEARHPALLVVAGDAYRLVGRDADAERSFLVAAQALTEPTAAQAPDGTPASDATPAPDQAPVPDGTENDPPPATDRPTIDASEEP